MPPPRALIIFESRLIYGMYQQRGYILIYFKKTNINFFIYFSVVLTLVKQKKTLLNLSRVKYC